MPEFEMCRYCGIGQGRHLEDCVRPRPERIVPIPTPPAGSFHTLNLNLGPNMTEMDGNVAAADLARMNVDLREGKRMFKRPQDYAEQFDDDVDRHQRMIDEARERVEARQANTFPIDPLEPTFTGPYFYSSGQQDVIEEADRAFIRTLSDLPPNPKQAYGVRKVPLAYVPSASMIHEALAFREGARKYGAYNWRINAVEAMTYMHAALRHIYSWIDGEDFDPDAPGGVRIHHLGNAKACLGIVLDSLETGNLIDDRPNEGSAPDVLKDHTLSEQGLETPYDDEDVAC